MDNGVVTSVVAAAKQQAGDLTAALEPARAYILQQFGSNGLIAAYIALGAIAVLLLFQIAKLAFSAVKYIVVPALALALIGSLISPLSFAILLPAAVAACSVVFLFKG